MQIYKDKSKVNRWHVGIYATTNKIWWAKMTKKGKDLKTIEINKVFKIVDYCETKEFNDFDKISLYIRNPLQSEKDLFNNNQNTKIGKVMNEIDLKRLILNHRFKYDQRIKKIKLNSLKETQEIPI